MGYTSRYQAYRSHHFLKPPFDTHIVFAAENAEWSVPRLGDQSTSQIPPGIGLGTLGGVTTHHLALHGQESFHIGLLGICA